MVVGVRVCQRRGRGYARSCRMGGVLERSARGRRNDGGGGSGQVRGAAGPVGGTNPSRELQVPSFSVGL